MFEEGRLHLDRTDPNNDFNPGANPLYWTPHRGVAEKFRRYAARRSPTGNTWMMRVDVPKAFLATLSQAHIPYSPNWKEFVWHNRRGAYRREEGQLKDFTKLDLLRGPIFTSLPCTDFRDIKEETLHKQITRQNCLKDPETGEEAEQYAFLCSRGSESRETYERLAEAVKGRTYLWVHPPRDPDEATGYPDVMRLDISYDTEQA